MTLYMSLSLFRYLPMSRLALSSVVHVACAFDLYVSLSVYTCVRSLYGYLLMCLRMFVSLCVYIGCSLCLCMSMCRYVSRGIYC